SRRELRTPGQHEEACTYDGDGGSSDHACISHRVDYNLLDIASSRLVVEITVIAASTVESDGHRRLWFLSDQTDGVSGRTDDREIGRADGAFECVGSGSAEHFRPDLCHRTVADAHQPAG